MKKIVAVMVSICIFMLIPVYGKGGKGSGFARKMVRQRTRATQKNEESRTALYLPETRYRFTPTPGLFPKGLKGSLLTSLLLMQGITAAISDSTAKLRDMPGSRLPQPQPKIPQPRTRADAPHHAPSSSSHAQPQTSTEQSVVPADVQSAQLHGQTNTTISPRVSAQPQPQLQLAATPGIQPQPQPTVTAVDAQPLPAVTQVSDSPVASSLAGVSSRPGVAFGDSDWSFVRGSFSPLSRNVEASYVIDRIAVIRNGYEIIVYPSLALVKLLKLDYRVIKNIKHSSNEIAFALKAVDEALEQGADPNNLDVVKSVTYGSVPPEVVELLFSNGYKKLSPQYFLRSVEQLNKHDFRSLSFCDMSNSRGHLMSYSVDHLVKEPSEVVNLLYKNLDAKAAASPKIPRILHSIWLRKPKSLKEIPPEDLAHVIRNHKLFCQTGEKWEHIVWTNDNTTFPQSAEVLKKAGVEVREISEVASRLQLFGKINKLVDQESYGMASDALRCDLVHDMGGVYADLNFRFDRNVEVDVHKFDFFSQGSTMLGFENYFFAAKPNHAVLGASLFLIKRALNKVESLSISITKDNEPKVTDAVTYHPVNFAYLKFANTEGNCDVVYPMPKPMVEERIGVLRAPEEMAREVEDAERRAAIVKKYCGRNSDVMDFLVDNAKFRAHMMEHWRFSETWVGMDDKNRPPSWEGVQQ